MTNHTITNRRQWILTTILLTFCIIFAGCEFDSPMTAAPTGKIDNALLGNWTHDKKPVKISRRDDFHYTVDYDGKVFSSYQSDIGTTHFLTLLDGKKYIFLEYELSDGGNKLTLKIVSDNLLDKNASSSTIRKVISNSLENAKLYTSSSLVLLKAEESKKSKNPPDNSGNGSDDNYKKAEAAYNKGDYTEAVRLATLLINDYFRSNVDGGDHVLRAKAYFKLQKYKAALADINYAIADKELLIGRELMAERYALQGDIYDKLAETKKAIESYTNALKRNPKLPNVYKSRGDCYLKDEGFWSARDDYNKAIALNPQMTDAYLKRGYVFENDAEDEEPNSSSFISAYKAALADFDKVLQLDPKNTDAMNSRGYIYFKQNKKADAIAEFKKVLAINPKDGLAIYNLQAIASGIELQTVLEYEKVIPYFV